MSGPFLGINMASGALRNFQRAIDTAGHNIANVNTRGYSRQTVEYGTLPPLNFFNKGWKSVGQGSVITSVNRIRDQYLDLSLNNSQSQHGKYSSLATGLKRIDAIYGEPSDSGVSAALDKFFNAWSGLGSNPSDAAARAQVRMSGQVLTDRVRNRFQDLSVLQTRTQSEIQGTMDQINGLAQQIAALNTQITTAAASGGSPNDLMDQRDLALSDLSKLVNVTKENFPDGSYAVYASGFTLVQGSQAREFPNSYNATNGTVTDGVLTYTLKGGALAGQLASLKEVETQKGNLDTLANTLRTQINTPHMTGINAQGNTGIQFFNDVASGPQNGAIDFNLSADIQASPNAIAAGLTGEPGDGSLAAMFAGMRDSSQAALGNVSFGKFFQDAVTKVANDAAYSDSALETEEAIMSQISQQQQAVSGVSIDDEMANLMKLQRSYQAAARALTVFDQVTEDLIGMLRR